jgi:actin-related protein 5
LNDFIFDRLSAGRNGRVTHPLILTECYATTDLARMIVLE